MKLIKNEITLFRQGKCLQAGGSISQQSQQLRTKWEAYHVLEQEYVHNDDTAPWLKACYAIYAKCQRQS